MASQGEGAAARPKCYLIVHNVSKKHNIGTLVRSAVAFNVHQVCLVGSKRFNVFGNHGSVNYVSLKHFDCLKDVRAYLKDEERQCTIYGVEIIEGAKPIQEHPFEGNAAFILGNEGQGLTEQQMAICDSYVYIPQYGKGTASLNVTVAGSIILHHFCIWANYKETDREGYKYVLGERPQRQMKRGVCLDPEQVKEERLARKAQGSADWLESEGHQDTQGEGPNEGVIASMFTTE